MVNSIQCILFYFYIKENIINPQLFQIIPMECERPLPDTGNEYDMTTIYKLTRKIVQIKGPLYTIYTIESHWNKLSDEDKLPITYPR